MTFEQVFYIMGPTCYRLEVVVVGTLSAVRNRISESCSAGLEQAVGQPLQLLDLMAQMRTLAMPPLTAVLGVTEDGRPLLMRLPAPTVGNVLVMGDRGCGKSSLLRTLILSLALFNPQRHLQLAIMDLGGSLQALADLPHLLTPLVTEPAAALEILGYLLEQHVTEAAEPAIVLVVDNLSQWGDEVSWALAELSDRGREAGIYLVCSLVWPLGLAWETIDWLNYVGLYGQLADSEVRRKAGVDGVGVAKLDRGEFVAAMEPDPLHFFGAFAPEGQVRELARALWQWPGRELLNSLQPDTPVGDWLE